MKSPFCQKNTINIFKWSFLLNCTLLFVKICILVKIQTQNCNYYKGVSLRIEPATVVGLYNETVCGSPTLLLRVKQLLTCQRWKGEEPELHLKSTCDFSVFVCLKIPETILTCHCSPQLLSLELSQQPPWSRSSCWVLMWALGMTL